MLKDNQLLLGDIKGYSDDMAICYYPHLCYRLCAVHIFIQDILKVSNSLKILMPFYISPMYSTESQKTDKKPIYQILFGPTKNLSHPFWVLLSAIWDFKGIAA